jgi:hypothetical protein
MQVHNDEQIILLQARVTVFENDDHRLETNDLPEKGNHKTDEAEHLWTGDQKGGLQY